MKKILASIVAFAAMTVGAFAAGTIPLSLSQQFDSQGRPLGGCLLYTYQAGTVATPQNAYQDAALTIALPNPIPCDAAGRLPQFFLADGQIKVRLTDKNGIVQLTADNILVIGPSSGGGGGGGQVDPTTIAQTGDVKYRYDDTSVAGWVRANGRTIGSASSGATERANADCQALFEYLWGKDSTLVVSGGRGASAAADWAANKTIALPDFRGRVLAGMDTMGAASADRLNPSITSGILGSSGGVQNHTLIQANLPAIKPPITISDPGHSHTYSAVSQFATTAGNAGNIITILSAISATTSHNLTGITAAFTNNLGSNQAFGLLQPTSVVTIFIKL